MKIHVTKEDIENGVMRSSCYCPIALALKRVLKIPCEVDVCDYVFINNWELEKNASIHLPKAAIDFIGLFDRDRSLTAKSFLPINPFSFEVEIPQELIKEDLL